MAANSTYGAQSAASKTPRRGGACQRVLSAFNNHPRQPFRARELHGLLGLPTDEASVNVTRARLARVARLVRQGILTHPGRGLYRKRT